MIDIISSSREKMMAQRKYDDKLKKEAVEAVLVTNQTATNGSGL